MNITKLLNDPFKRPDPPDQYDCSAYDETLSQDTRLISYGGVIHHKFTAMALGPTDVSTTRQGYDTLETTTDCYQETCPFMRSQPLFVRGSGLENVDMGQSMQTLSCHDDGDTGDHHTVDKELYSTSTTLESSTFPSGTAADPMELMADHSPSPVPPDIHVNKKNRTQTFTPPTIEHGNHQAMALDTSRTLNGSVQSNAPPQSLGVYQGSIAKTYQDSGNYNSHIDSIMPATPQRGSPRSRRAATAGSSIVRSSDVFSPSPLSHAHPASSLPDNGSSYAGSSHVAESTDQANIATESFTAIDPDLAQYPKSTCKSSTSPHPRSTHRPSTHSNPRSVLARRSTASSTGLKSPFRGHQGNQSSLIDLTAGSQPSTGAHTDVSLSDSHGTRTSCASKEGNATAAFQKIYTPPKSSRQIPAEIPSNLSGRKRSRAGPLVNLYDEVIRDPAFSRFMNETRIANTTSHPQSASRHSPEAPETPAGPGVQEVQEIPEVPAGPEISVPPSPLPHKRARPGETAGDEDPFEGFNSGSEPDDTDDEDFGAGRAAASPSPSSADETGSRSPAPTDDGEDDDAPTSGKKRRISSGVQKPNTKSAARAERAGAKVVAEWKPKIRRSRGGAGDWPVASEAGRIKDGTLVDRDVGGRKRGFEEKSVEESGFVVDDEDMEDEVSGGDEGASDGDEEEAEQQEEEAIGRPIGNTGRNGKGWVLVARKKKGKRVLMWELRA